MVATTVELDRAITDFIRLLERDIRVETIVLYGSYLHGEPHEWSDFDLAVISPDFENMAMWQRQEMIATATVYRDRRVSPMGYPSSEYHNPGPHSFLGEIIRTGRVVYQAPVD